MVTSNAAVSVMPYEICPGVESMEAIKLVLEGLHLPPHQSFLLGNLLECRLQAGDQGGRSQDIAEANEYKRLLYKYGAGHLPLRPIGSALWPASFNVESGLMRLRDDGRTPNK